MNRLKAIYANIADDFSGFAISADQDYRVCDLAIDFCEDVPTQPMDAVIRLRDEFADAGATAKISSIHVNAWFGSFDKLSMSKWFFEEELGAKLDTFKAMTIYVGDSPNDEPMFAYFPHSVGVANVRQFVDQMDHPPCWVTIEPGGYGFKELAEHVLNNR